MAPNRGVLRTWYVGAAAAGLPPLAGSLVDRLLDTPWWAVALTVPCSAVLGALAYRTRLWMEVTRLTQMGVEVRTWYGRRRTVPRSSIAGMAMVTVKSVSFVLPYILFLDPRGRCLARTPVQGVDRTTQVQFARLLGVPIADEVGFFRRPRELRDRYPGSLSWISAHPTVCGYLLGLALIVVAIAVVVRGA